MTKHTKTESLIEIYKKAWEIKQANPEAVLLVNENITELVTGLKKATLRKKRWEGVEPRFYKIHGKVLYDFFELQDFVNSCQAVSTSQKK